MSKLNEVVSEMKKAGLTKEASIVEALGPQHELSHAEKDKIKYNIAERYAKLIKADCIDKKLKWRAWSHEPGFANQNIELDLLDGILAAIDKVTN